MKKLIVTAALIFAVSTSLRAENAANQAQDQFYFFTAPILTTGGGNNTGFGGEVLVHKGVGVGAELGYAGPDWSFQGNEAIGVGSVDACYHFYGNRTSRRYEPFATGGYSLYFGQRTTLKSGFNLGAGVNIWMIKHVAMRLELRYQGGISYFGGYSPFAHYFALRAGLTLR